MKTGLNWMASPLPEMDDSIEGWFKMLCLVVTAVAITAVIVWLFFRILDGTKVSKPADDADDLETDELPDRDDVDELQPTPVQQPKTWVAEIILPKDDSKQPTYFFHCPTSKPKQGVTNQQISSVGLNQIFNQLSKGITGLNCFPVDEYIFCQGLMFSLTELHCIGYIQPLLT